MMAQLVPMTVEVRGAAVARFVVWAAGPMSKIIRLVTPRGAELMCVGIAALISMSINLATARNEIPLPNNEAP
jgi:hypothetical protein